MKLSYIEEASPEFGRDEYHKSVHKPEGSEDSQHHEPVPQEDVDLHIQNVSRQHTHAVVQFYIARSTKFPEEKQWQLIILINTDCQA